MSALHNHFDWLLVLSAKKGDFFSHFVLQHEMFCVRILHMYNKPCKIFK